MNRVSDFTYPTGERWLEVSPATGGSNLCLVLSRPERPAGIETGVVLVSSDVLADLAIIRAHGLDVDGGAAVRGRDRVVERRSARRCANADPDTRPDGNSFLIVAAS